ncbi:MAG TPA: FAD-dependent oxidoreductase [Burkholderiaceae bacterium]
MKIAVVGAGIAGLSCAYQLVRAGQDVTLLEAGDYFGGHSHTVDVTLEGKTCGVDTGFLVFNHKTYPNLVRLFADLGVETAASDMSFSVKTPIAGLFGQRLLEWAGRDLDTVFAQRRNIASPRFLGMLRDILRFNREATAIALSTVPTVGELSLGEFLESHGYGASFREWYLLPMAGCIWSCPTAQMLAFPISTFARFCHNHGLLQVEDRPQWHTVKGGSRNYVEKMLRAIPDKRCNVAVDRLTRFNHGGVRRVLLETNTGKMEFDQVVLACHSDQSLRMLADASAAEQAVLAAIPYQPNRAVLHTDASLLPQNRKAWSAWNYESISGAEPRVCVHYLINQLQPLPFATPVIVSLNPIDAPAREHVLAEFDYSHPVFDSGAIVAQARLDNIQGRDNVWFAGAWTGYGFHEDGLKSGLKVAQSLLDLDLESSMRDAA